MPNVTLYVMENIVLHRQPHDSFGSLNVVILKPESCIIFILTQDVVRIEKNVPNEHQSGGFFGYHYKSGINL